ncbi:AtzH-like domain-containing protein [Propylenella binzhouense]|uniref:DUF3225 domain-containing protein n=1 Tax=Propylenella binzhouense TaxID=2555902 RepID=A0A964T505_9HYPH|nr:AtzH-like domain-containing protein [Propylenella binzhouense]MYZ48626.1 DUF3225 domain-containing protein [Propylenella binzhouense]
MIEEIDNEETVAEVRDCFLRYNRALDAGDVDALNGFFWNSPATVRFGPGETLFGYDAIAGFRSNRWRGAGPARRIEEVVVTAYGRDVATTNALIRSGNGALSRQSQTWIRRPEGWRIAAAHVSAAPA